MCDDKYDSLVVDIGCIMGDMRKEMLGIEILRNSDQVELDLPDYMFFSGKLDILKKYHDKLNEVL
jgi:hypothetical protein